MSENKLIYICSPYAGDIEKNVEFAKATCRYAIRQNCTPVLYCAVMLCWFAN